MNNLHHTLYRTACQKIINIRAISLAWLMLLFFGLTSTSFKAQQYPVQIIPVVTPPYSVRLVDYATSSDEKVQLQLLMTDLQEPQHEVGIKFWLASGSNTIAQSTEYVVGFQPFTLTPGNQVTLTNVDLRSLFELQNLSGINATQYAQPLPDGVYQFCFQAYDFYTKNALSVKQCATVFLTQYDPPMLNLPSNGEKKQAVTPYGGGNNILFQWMPRQIAPNTRYTFTLKELWDMEQSPISGFLSAPPLWEEETTLTHLNYGLGNTPLIPGKRYAWQVRAQSGNPVWGGNPTEDNGVYKNNGLSEIYYFDYVENCDPPTLLMAKNVGRGRVELSWSVAGEPSNLYQVQYRLKGGTTDWITQESYQPKYIITNLEDLTEYEYRIGNVCGEVSMSSNWQEEEGNAYVFSGIQYFTTDSEDATNEDYQCGVMPSIDIANQNLLQGLLGVNEEFTAGDFPVTVIQATGSNGIYSGEGYIVVPYLLDTKVKVSFSNIKLNTDKQLISGVIETTYDINESAVDYASEPIGELFGDQGVKDITVDFEIKEILYSATPPPGKVTIVGFGTGEDSNGDGGTNGGGSGDGAQMDLKGGKDYMITDTKGNVWTVDEEGNVTKETLAQGGASTPENTEGVNNNGEVTEYTATGVRVDFENAPSSKYAFDAPQKVLTEDYQKVDGKIVPFKAVENKKTDVFIAKVDIEDTAVKSDSIVFKTSKGVEIPSKRITGTDNYELTLTGKFSYGKEQVQAVIKQGEKYKVAGAFNLVHISPKTIKLNLVPTKGVSITEAQKEAVKKIYSPIAIEVNISVKPSFDVTEYLDESGELSTLDAKGALSTYSEVQNNIISDYKRSHNIDVQSYYIFVTDKPSSTGQAGYMRLNNQFGFVFDETAKTIAHELGHGALQLEHPFKKYEGILSEGSTDYLMDYSDGTKFGYTDWQQVNDPALKLYSFQEQSEGEFSGIRLTPDWKPFKYESSSTHGNNTCMNNGGICKIVKDGNEYSYENGDYYYTDKNNQKIPLKITYEPFAQNVTVVDYSKGCGKLYQVNLKDLKAKFNANSSVDFSNSIFKYTRDIACFDDNASLEENSLGKQFYDLHITTSMSDDVKAEMIKVAKLVDEMGKDIYNSYVYSKEKEYNPYNYALLPPLHYPKKIESIEDVKSLYETLNKHYQNCLKIENRDFKNGDELVKFFNDSFCVGGIMRKATTVVPFYKLTAERRVQLLELLANNGSMSSNWSISGCPKHENVILYILKTTPDEQTKNVLDGLYNNKLLYHFVDGMNGVNFDQFITILTTWVFKDYKPNAQTVSSALADKRFLLFNDNYFGRLNAEKMNADGGVHLIVKKWFDSNKEYEVNSTPYNYIYVKFQNDFNAGSTKFAKGQTYKLPAIYAYMLMVEDTRSKWKTSGKIAIDVGLCALGVGELKAAIQSGQWATAVLAATDMGIGIGDIVVNTAFRNEIQQAYPDFYNNWQTISTAYGIARSAQIGLKEMYKRANIESWIMKTDASLSQESRQLAVKMQNELQNPENFAEFADEGLQEINKLENQVTAIQNKSFIEGRELDADAVNNYLYRTFGNKSPYKLGTKVKDIKIPVGKKLYCVEEESQSLPGAWLGDQLFNSLDEVREKLALLEEFKSSSKKLVIREYTVKKSFGTRMGIVGEQKEMINGVEKTYIGGANQYEFGAFKNNWTEYLDISSRKTVKTLN